jgi:hypothetical protein
VQAYRRDYQQGAKAELASSHLWKSLLLERLALNDPMGNDMTTKYASAAKHWKK